MTLKLVLSLLSITMICTLTGRGLESTALDSLKVDLCDRLCSLQEPEMPAERRRARLYDITLRQLERESPNRLVDSLRVTQVIMRLQRALPNDAQMQALLDTCLEKFLDELADDLSWIEEALALADEANPFIRRTQFRLDRANQLVTDAMAEGDLRHQTILARRAGIFTALALRTAIRAVQRSDVWPPESGFSHESYFSGHDYQGTSTCLRCHSEIGDNILTTGHWTWKGRTANVQGMEREYHGKVDFINNFCIAIATNEPRCTQCHIGVGYANKDFDFSDPTQIDCLVCHDQTGTYAKDPKAAGAPVGTVDLQAVASSVAINGGKPTRQACGSCHFKAGGGDNVKHGDLSTDLVSTTREYDVHMGTDGADMSCADCHQVKRDARGEVVSHGIGGMPFHSVREGDMRQCSDCHQRDPHRDNPDVKQMVDGHQSLACQVCHIPAIARKKATKTEWYWETAGDKERVPVVDPETGMPDYDVKKGDFVWEKNVRPVLKRYNGKWNRMVMNVNDTYTETPVVLAEPLSSPGSKIYPFKKMVGTQPADAENQTILVPHLFGKGSGDNPYWGLFDWDLALQDGADYTGQSYTGNYTFVPTVFYLTVNHEVAPKEMALGSGGNCGDCHAPGAIDWDELNREPPEIR